MATAITPTSGGVKQYPKGLSTVTLLAEEPQTGYHFAQVTFKAKEVLPRGKGIQGTCYVLAWALRWLGFNFDPLRIRGPKNREGKSGRAQAHRSPTGKAMPFP